MNKKKIVIIGGGFGGMNLAKKLSSKYFDVVLIDRHNYHTFQPLLYQVATGGLEPSSIAYPIRRIFRNQKGFRFKMALVNKVNAETNTIETDVGDVTYDYLIIATGSSNNFFHFEPVRDSFLSLKTVNEALQIKNSLMAHLEYLNTIPRRLLESETINVSIVGAGPAGVEIAGALAEMKSKVLPKDFPEFDFDKMQIYLFEATDKVLANMSPRSSKYGLKYLEKLGVHVVLNAMVKKFDKKEIVLSNGTKYKSRNVIWTAGVKVESLAGMEKKDFTFGNRLAVNEFNQLLHHENIFAIGDAAAHISERDPRGLPMLAQVAIQHAHQLGENLIRMVKGKKMQPFKYKNLGVMATVGRNKAVVDLPGLKMQGFIAWFIWMFIHLMALVGFRNKLITFINWTQNYWSYDRPLGAIFRKYKDDTKTSE